MHPPRVTSSDVVVVDVQLQFGYPLDVRCMACRPRARDSVLSLVAAVLELVQDRVSVRSVRLLVRLVVTDPVECRDVSRRCRVAFALCKVHSRLQSCIHSLASPCRSFIHECGVMLSCCRVVVSR
jgi:CO/xanthine dehydrogenase FAD-binding subunit